MQEIKNPMYIVLDNVEIEQQTPKPNQPNYCRVVFFGGEMRVENPNLLTGKYERVEVSCKLSAQVVGGKDNKFVGTSVRFGAVRNSVIKQKEKAA